MVVHADGEYFKEGEHRHAKDVDGAHVEVVAFVDFAEFSDFISVDILLT